MVFVKEWVCTLLHALLSLVLVWGVLFSNTTIQMVAILSCLILILLGIRWFDGCWLTHHEVAPEKLTLTDYGKAFSLENFAEPLSNRRYEEIVVANLLFVHLIKMFTLSVLPVKMFF